MKPPCMIVVQYILPSLRVTIAKQLIDEHGLLKTEVAEKMDLTPAAVTQYLKSSRGGIASDLVEHSSKAMSLISEISRDLVAGDTPSDILLLKLCRVCSVVRSEGLLCGLHMEAMPSLKELDSCACSLGLIAWKENNDRQK